MPSWMDPCAGCGSSLPLDVPAREASSHPAAPARKSMGRGHRALHKGKTSCGAVLALGCEEREGLLLSHNPLLPPTSLVR